VTGRLEGRTALITGASRGIGFAIAEAFAREGAHLILNATTEPGLESAKAALAKFDVDIACVAADLSRSDEVEKLFAAALEHQPELDVLVNNAGIHIGKPFTEYAMDEFDHLMKINVSAVFQLSQLAVRHMRARDKQKLGKGKIINIASTAGKWESMNQAAYNTSKHAVVGLTRCVALENAKNGINVNAICPGLVETDIVRNAEAKMKAAGLSEDEFRERIEAQIPMGRMLQPQEVANIAIYLASDESAGMTGQTITISGGMRMG
jgi:NAD(P)-dependent dehydrogenase (short-subunit alcohol dehydrogenase family)